MDKKLYQLLFYAIRATYPSMKVSPLWPLAQAIHETGNFTSRLCVEENNLHGMNYPTTRKTCAIGKTDKGFCRYRSKFDSIRDYFMWLDYWKLYTDEQLLDFIKTRYATDPTYYNKVATVYNTLGADILKPGPVLAGAGAVGLVAIAARKALSGGAPTKRKSGW